MNRTATRELIRSKHIKMSSWCRAHGVSYPLVNAMLKSDRPLLETRRQLEAIEMLKADGLYVPSDDEVDFVSGEHAHEA